MSKNVTLNIYNTGSGIIRHFMKGGGDVWGPNWGGGGVSCYLQYPYIYLKIVPHGKTV